MNARLAFILLAAVVAFLLFGSIAYAGEVGAMLDMATIALAQSYAQVYSNLDPEEIEAVILTESGGNPNSENPADPSVGLMGVTLLIGRAYAGATSLNQLFDPDTNIKAGAGYLSELKGKYGERFPNSDPQNGWIQMYNEGEPHFLAGERVVSYQTKYLKHLAAVGGTP